MRVFDMLCQLVNPLGRQSQGLAHVARRRARPVGNRFGRNARPIAAVLAIKILNYFLAPLMFEVDVDVRRFAALAAHEPLEEHVHPLGVDGGNAEAVADGRVGGRAASLAEDAPPPGESNQVPNREKIRLVMQFRDQLQLVLQQPADLFRHAAGPAPPRANPSEPSEVLDRRHARRGQLLRILVAKLVERKRTTIGDLQGAAERLGASAKAAAISAGDFRCRWALGNKCRVTSATVELWRTAVSTSCNAARWDT